MAGINYNVILIGRSSKALISKDYSPISLESWESELASGSLKNGVMNSTGDISAFLERSPEPAILVDNTSSETLANAYPFLIDQGISIVTPNKKAFSSDLGLWSSIFKSALKPKGGLVYYEATVGAGLPILDTLRGLVDTGDEVVKIEGILSGTLSYIFNEYSKIGENESSDNLVQFSEIVNKAREHGYTEPDPREDLNGLDVARKLTILARISGYKVPHPTAFPVRNLITKPLRETETVSEFLVNLPKYDTVLEKLRKQAQAERKVIRYVGKIDFSGPPSINVSIEKYETFFHYYYYFNYFNYFNYFH